MSNYATRTLSFFQLAAVVSLFAMASVHANESDFRFCKELSLPTIDTEELVSVNLGEVIYKSTSDHFNDIRIWNTRNEQVPFLLRRQRTKRSRTRRRTWRANEPSIRPLPDGGLEIQFALKDAQSSPEGMRIVSPLRNFEQRVRVFGSEDKADWQPIGSEEAMFDYSRYMDVRDDSVDLPPTRYRNFRIVIDDVTSEQESRLLELTRRLRGDMETERVEKITVDRRPFRIDRIELWKDVTESNFSNDKVRTYPIEGFRVEEHPEEKQTWVFVDTPRAPLTTFTLETPAKNFSRRVSIDREESQGEERQWRNLSSSVLSRIDFRDLSREKLDLPLKESRHATYRITIDNRDSPPLEITGVQTAGPVYQALFLASPSEAYRVVYSAENAKSPSYDTVAIDQVLNAGFEPLSAELQDQSELPRSPASTKTYDPLRDPKVLVGTILLLVVVLGYSLYSALRRMDRLEPE